MEIRLERWRGLIDAFSRGPGLSKEKLAEAAGVSLQVLKPRYQHPKQSTMLKVATTAAELLHLDDEQAEQLMAWLAGEAEPAIGQFVADLPKLRQCLDCNGWFDPTPQPGRPAVFIPSKGRCTNCNQKRDRVLKSASSPRQVEFRGELRAKLPEMRTADPKLAEAVVAALAEPEAVTVPKLAARIDPKARDVAALRRNVAARLRRFVTVAALLRVLQGDAANATPMQRTNVPVRRDGTRRRPLTLGSGSPPPTPRRRRKGAQSAAGRYFSTEEARP